MIFEPNSRISWRPPGPSCDSNIRGLLSPAHRMSPNISLETQEKHQIKITDQTSITECIEFYRLAFAREWDDPVWAPMGTKALEAFQCLRIHIANVEFQCSPVKIQCGKSVAISSFKQARLCCKEVLQQVISEKIPAYSCRIWAGHGGDVIRNLHVFLSNQIKGQVSSQASLHCRL